MIVLVHDPVIAAGCAYTCTYAIAPSASCRGKVAESCRHAPTEGRRGACHGRNVRGAGAWPGKDAVSTCSKRPLPCSAGQLGSNCTGMTVDNKGERKPVTRSGEPGTTLQAREKLMWSAMTGRSFSAAAAASEVATVDRGGRQ